MQTLREDVETTLSSLEEQMLEVLGSVESPNQMNDRKREVERDMKQKRDELRQEISSLRRERVGN